MAAFEANSRWNVRHPDVALQTCRRFSARIRVIAPHEHRSGLGVGPGPWPYVLRASEAARRISERVLGVGI